MLRMAVLMRLRADLRTRWRALLGLALLLGLVGGVALTATAGARRTDTAYTRLLARANAPQVTVIVTDSDATGTPPAGQPKDKFFVAGAGRTAVSGRTLCGPGGCRCSWVEYGSGTPSQGGAGRVPGLVTRCGG
jgi:hypothetical protein